MNRRVGRPADTPAEVYHFWHTYDFRVDDDLRVSVVAAGIESRQAAPDLTAMVALISAGNRPAIVFRMAP